MTGKALLGELSFTRTDLVNSTIYISGTLGYGFGQGYSIHHKCIVYEQFVSTHKVDLHQITS